ncbi:MAG: N-acetylmannosaminyltransferase, partial [uncultured Solirubrobacteraceae bacterium]
GVPLPDSRPACDRYGARPRDPAGAHRLRPRHRLDGGHEVARGPRIRLRGRGPHRDGGARGSRAAGRRPRRELHGARRTAAGLGAQRPRPRPAGARLRPDPDVAGVRARASVRCALLPLRRARRGRAAGPGGAARGRASRPADRRHPLPAVPAAHRAGGGRCGGRHRRLRSRRRVGRHRRPQAGEVDGADAPAAAGSGAGRSRGRVRLPRRAGPAGAAVAAGAGARVGVPAGAGAAPAVEALPALQPALRDRLRASVRAPPPAGARL